MKLATRVPHPIPYQGSKRALAGAILAQLPGPVDRLVEPFAGSAAVSLAAAHQGLACQFWINDAHAPLADLWREIIERPCELATTYGRLWEDQIGNEREFFDEVRERFNQSPAPGLLLYLLARCVKAAIRYNSRGEFNNAPDNRRRGARPHEMTARVLGAAELLRNRTIVTSHDYRAVLAACRDDDLIYLDPPYQGVSRQRDSRYAPSVDHDEFRDALQQLCENRRLFLVSYDGRLGTHHYGIPLPRRLGLKRLELCAGRSAQATLLGREKVTYESLYLSPALVEWSKQSRADTRRGQKTKPVTHET